MKKKKIAVFAIGWAYQILYKYMIGVKDGFEGYPADVYLFLCHTTFSDPESYYQGEVNIFQLPYLGDFDGALVLANTIDFPQILDDISKRCSRAEIPVIYTGNDRQDGYFVGSDNYVGAKALYDHIIKDHGARKILFIAGSRESMDSNTRLKALQDAMKENGLELPEEDIFYSNWIPTEGTDYIERRIREGYEPDAIVCANDSMAMMFCRDLKRQGFPCPEKIIVTGFDNDPYAQIYDPVISTVDQRFDLLGKKAAETLIRLFNGETCERRQTIPCEFVLGESCGCVSSKDFVRMRKNLGRDKFVEDVTRTVFDQGLFTMERTILKGTAYRDLKDSFRSIHTTRSTDYQGHSFHVVLDPLYEQAVYNQQRHLRKKGYAPTMDAVISIAWDEQINDPEFETRKLIPLPLPEEENHQYIFLPLHEGSGNMGYIVFGDDLEKINGDDFLRKYVERLSIILGSYLRDLQLNVLHNRLLEMTETDALTHVKNRTAYRARVEKLDSKIKKDPDLAFAVAVFDLNNLKKINDKYGHEMGDDYIIDSCRLICKTYKKSAVYRIGGDEFAVVLENDDYENKEELFREMQTTMEDLQEQDISEIKKISVAAGIAVFDRETDPDYASVFKRADEKMYENKVLMKGTRA